MQKSQIIKIILSNLTIELNDTLFYMPGETIKGKIKLFPDYKLNLKNNVLHFKLKLVQYEFWEYANIKTEELKNIQKTNIKETTLNYTIKDEDYNSIIFEKEINNAEKDSIILIEKIKEENDNFLLIPFEFTIDKNNQNLLPTFQFKDNTYILGIRHILIIESIEYGSVNYIGLFIGKQKNENLLGEKQITNNYNTILGSLNLIVTIPKQTFYFCEEIPVKIDSNINALFKKLIKQKINYIEKQNGQDI